MFQVSRDKLGSDKESNIKFYTAFQKILKTCNQVSDVNFKALQAVLRHRIPIDKSPELKSCIEDVPYSKTFDCIILLIVDSFNEKENVVNQSKRQKTKDNRVNNHKYR